MCYWEKLKGKPSWNKGKIGIYKHTTEWKNQARERFTGIRNPRWKGGVSKDKRHYKIIGRIRKAEVGGSHTLIQLQELKAKYGFMCLCCKKCEPEIKLTIDHIIPISQWKSYIQFHPEIKYQCNDIENIQPLCKSCNSRKQIKIINYSFSGNNLKI